MPKTSITIPIALFMLLILCMCGVVMLGIDDAVTHVTLREMTHQQKQETILLQKATALIDAARIADADLENSNGALRLIAKEDERELQACELRKRYIDGSSLYTVPSRTTPVK